MADISGFDMKPTIDWYEANGWRLSRCLPWSSGRKFPYPFYGQRYSHLTEGQLTVLYNLFPEPARARSVLKRVTGKPPAWFHKKSTPAKPIPTTKREEALSHTAIIPASIDYKIKETKVVGSRVFLYQIPNGVCSKNTRRIILSQSFTHELAHSIIAPVWSENCYLRRPDDDTIIGGFEYLLSFVEIAEHYPPVSHYATAYRTGKNEFPDNLHLLRRAIEEELAETISAFLLGFAFCGDTERSYNPFTDRPEIKKFIRGFLNAYPE